MFLAGGEIEVNIQNDMKIKVKGKKLYSCNVHVFKHYRYLFNVLYYSLFCIFISFNNFIGQK